MATPPRDQIEHVLAEIVREALKTGKSVEVPGLGIFAVAHHESTQRQAEDGEVTLLPPRDEIVFTPDQ